MVRSRARARRGVLATLLLAATALAACGTQRDPDPQHLLVWSLDAQTDRIAATRAIVDRFERGSDVEVELVPVDETQLPQLIAGASQTGNLPDVIGGLSLANVRALDSYDVLDRRAATDVMRRLGERTFAPASVELTSQDGENLSVPSDAWAQMLVYRTDLFEKAGLAPPTTYAALRKAAQELTGDGRFGITLATDAADVFTAQSFESLALANDCALVDRAGRVGLGSRQCAQTLDLYDALARDYSPAGTETVDTTRASYFSGQAAMVLWSSFILDELAGLRGDALPTCPECEDDPTWLAKHSGVVTALRGPSGDRPRGYSEIVSWVMTDNGKRRAAEEFVGWMLTDGYLDWIGITPEGKYPARRGPRPGSTEYVDAWPGLKAGVDKRRPLASIYDRRTVAQITAVLDDVDRWAIPQGQGALLGPTNAELPVPRAVAGLANGSLSAREAATEMTDAVTEIQQSQE